MAKAIYDKIKDHKIKYKIDVSWPELPFTLKKHNSYKFLNFCEKKTSFQNNRVRLGSILAIAVLTTYYYYLLLSFEACEIDKKLVCKIVLPKKGKYRYINGLG